MYTVMSNVGKREVKCTNPVVSFFFLFCSLTYWMRIGGGRSEKSSSASGGVWILVEGGTAMLLDGNGAIKSDGKDGEWQKTDEINSAT
jgi:hypothetical protein